MPVKDDKQELTNTFLSSSLQQSSSNDSASPENRSTKEDTQVLNDSVHQAISLVSLDEEQNQIEENKQLSFDTSIEQQEKQRESTPVISLSVLRPNAAPFVSLSATEVNQSISTGDESDDENDSNESPITSGKELNRSKLDVE